MLSIHGLAEGIGMWISSWLVGSRIGFAKLYCIMLNKPERHGEEITSTLSKLVIVLLYSKYNIYLRTPSRYMRLKQSHT